MQRSSSARARLPRQPHLRRERKGRATALRARTEPFAPSATSRATGHVFALRRYPTMRADRQVGRPIFAPPRPLPASRGSRPP
jgi:hypothetical protein